MMDRIDWSDIDEKELDAFHRRLALVETLIDGSIEETERVQARHDYLREHGVCERTIRNYLKRYREDGPEALEMASSFDHFVANNIDQPRAWNALPESPQLESAGDGLLNLLFAGLGNSVGVSVHRVGVGMMEQAIKHGGGHYSVTHHLRPPVEVLV